MDNNVWQVGNYTMVAEYPVDPKHPLIYTWNAEPTLGECQALGILHNQDRYYVCEFILVYVSKGEEPDSAFELYYEPIEKYDIGTLTPQGFETLEESTLVLMETMRERSK